MSDQDKPEAPAILNSAVDMTDVAEVGDATSDAFDEIDASHIVSLIKALKDKDSDVDVRIGAANALAKIGNERAISALIEMLGDKNWRTGLLRIAVADALGETGDASAVPALIGVITDRDYYIDRDYMVRSSAVIALGKLGDARAVPALIEALGDKALIVHYGANYALRKIGVIAIPLLMDALKDTNVERQAGAANVLAKVGGASVLIDALGDNDWGVRRRAAHELVSLGVIAVSPLIEALKDKPSSSVAEALGAIGDASAVPALIKALQDEDRYVRKSAAEALGKIGDASTVPALIEALGDEGWEVRIRAADALGEIGGASAVPALIEALGDDILGVRIIALKAILFKIGGTATPALIEALSDTSNKIEKAVIGLIVDALKDKSSSSAIIAQGKIEGIWRAGQDKPEAPTLLNSAVDETDIAEVEEEEKKEFRVNVSRYVTYKGSVSVWATDEDVAIAEAQSTSASDIDWDTDGPMGGGLNEEADDEFEIESYEEE